MTTFRETYGWMRRALEAERGLTAERARFARIADAAEQIAKDAARDPGGYSDGAEGFRWAAEHIRAAIKETE